jgi:hypothetical protein
MMFPEFESLLAASHATAAFRSDLAAFSSREPAERIRVVGPSPRVKVLRTIAQLLHAEPLLAVDRVSVQAVSGCADFVGTLTVTDAAGNAHVYEFEWNCEWKARQLGYVDGFGFPDQIRAAQEFGWDCFERWADRSSTAIQPAA